MSNDKTEELIPPDGYEFVQEKALIMEGDMWICKDGRLAVATVRPGWYHALAYGELVRPIKKMQVKRTYHTRSKILI